MDQMKSIYSISIVKKILKYTLKIAIEGILVGIVAGLIVSYLFDVPSISLNKTTIKIHKDNLDVNFSYENKGTDPAIDFSMKCLYGKNGDEPQQFKLWSPQHCSRIEVGDVFSYTATSLPIYSKNSNAIFLIMIRYSDSDPFRQFINEKILRNKYAICKWAVHRGDENYLSDISKNQKEKYYDDLMKIISK